MTDPGPVYISLDEWLFVAAEILQVDPGTIHRVADLGLADSALHAPAAGFGDHEAYPYLIDKAAVLAVHLVKNHALPDANKRTSFITMIVFLKRNGRRWAPPDVDDSVATMVAVADGTLGAVGLARWLRRHTS